MRHILGCAGVLLVLVAPTVRADTQVPLVAPESATDAGVAAAPESIPLVAPPEAPADAGALAPPPLAPSPSSPDAGLFVPSLSPPPADAGIFIPGQAPPPAADAGVFVPSGAGSASPPAPSGDFVKGELSTLLGADRLVDKFNRVGVSLGVNVIGGIYYALVEPQLDLHLFGVNFGLAVPLNFEVLDPHVSSTTGKFELTNHPGQLRPQDWATPQQYFRVLNYLTYGHKEDRLYVSVGQVYAETVGHGEIMRRYSPNIDINTTRVSAEVDAYNDYAGFEALTNDITRWNIVGGLAFVKPAAFFSSDDILRTLSIGATYVIDTQAPRTLAVVSYPGSGLLGCSCQPQEDANGNLITRNGAVSVGGVDAEIKVFKTQNVDIKPFVDYSHLFGGGGGLTAGALARINLGTETVHAFRFIAEGRYLGADYKPEYFDTFYEVDKYIYDAGIKRPAASYVGAPITNQPAPQTQYQLVTTGGAGFGSNRAGYYLEASYGVRGYIGATFALEGDSATNRKNFIAHLELPDLWIVQLFASYYKRDMTGFGDLTSLDTSTIILAGARIKLLPILFINLRAYQTYVFDSAASHDYISSQGVEGDVEFGYEF
jgi:hypothetical protein